MKKQFLYLFGFLALMGCTDDDDVFVSQGVAEPGIVDESVVNGEVNGDVFAKLNLDYPGLEEVKKCYEAQDLSGAAAALLEYFRNKDVVNPNVNLINPNPSEGEKRIADQALEENGYRFYVNIGKSESGTYEGADAVYYSFKKDDGTIDWGMEPAGLGSEFSYQQHRWQWMTPQAETYRATRDEKYVESWINVYNSWLKAFPCPKGEDGGYKIFDSPKVNDADYKNDPYQWKGLQTAERVLVMTDILPYFIWSKSFTPALLTTFLNSLTEHVGMIQNNYYEEGNIRVTQLQAVATAGILMPEFKDAQNWIDTSCNMINEEMDSQFLDDGVQFELDPSYHISAIADFLNIVNLSELAIKSGVSTPLSSEIVSRLEKSMEFVADIAYPDLTIDNWNDTRAISYDPTWDDPVNKTGRHSGALQNNLKKYLNYFPNNKYLLYRAWEESTSKGGEAPDWYTKAYADGGYYMLRNWEGKNSIMMVLKNCNTQGKSIWHNQGDNGTFGLWYKGRNFFPDAGCYSYAKTSSEEGFTERSTYGEAKNHNTLTMTTKVIPDNCREGKLLKQESGANYELVVTQNKHYYSGYLDGTNADIYHRRAVFFVDKRFYVLVDEAFCSDVSVKVPKTNLQFHLLSDKENKAVMDNIKESNLADGSYGTENIVGNGLGAHTMFATGPNVLFRTFVGTKKAGFQMMKQKASNSLAVSNDLLNTIGEKRDSYQININANLGTSRFITIIYPFDDQVDTSMTMKASFTDEGNNVVAPIGVETGGASIEVEIGNKTYDLEYAL